MQFVGLPSWRFAEGFEQASLTALFVRDAASLEVPAGAGLPPRLDDAVPGRFVGLDADARAQAAADWPAWWSAIVAVEVERQQGRPAGVDQATRLRQMVGAPAGVFDPPAFQSLADRPALRRAAQETFEDARRWEHDQRRALLARLPDSAGHFPYDIVRAVAQEVAHGRDVSPAAVQGCALVLPVEGRWWHRARPGAVLCSVHAARDPATARVVLKDAFESGLAA
jgi:hypothetical protein